MTATLTRPSLLAVRIESIPVALRQEHRWMLWRSSLRDDRWTKIPYQRNGQLARANDPSTWCTFDEAVAAYRTGRFDGLGFALGDGWAGIDIDDCYTDTGDAVDAARPLLDALQEIGAYVDRSPGGLGAKAFGLALPDRIGFQIDYAKHGCVTAWLGARFFTVTGHGGGNPLADLTPVIDRWSPLAQGPFAHDSSLRDRTGWSGAAEATDDDLLIYAVGADNGDKFLALWRGDTSAYASASEADLALACLQAFWTNGDAERIDRLFRQSALMRSKWNTPSYRRSTLSKALR